MIYKCIFYDEKSKRRTITIEKETQNELYDYIDKNNMKVVKLEEVISFSRKNCLKSEDLFFLCKQLSILIESGYEITKALKVVQDKSNKATYNILNEIINYLHEGNSLYESFEKTNRFSIFFTNMMKAGEASGNLGEIMKDLAIYYEKEDKLKKKIIDELTYPTILFFLMIFALITMLISVVPSYEQIYLNSEVPPPMSTQMLIETSKIFREYGIYLTTGFIGIILLLVKTVRNSSKLRYFIKSINFKIPIVKDVYQLIITTKFSRTLNILIKGGIQITNAIDMSSKVVENEFIISKTKNIKRSILQGNSIGYSINTAGVFPKLFISMVNVGEESGKLEEILDTINIFYESELEHKLDQLMKRAQPAIMVAMSFLVGIFLLTMVVPMMDVVTNI